MVYHKDDSLGFISFEGTEGETTHENSNGMSGGIIYDLQPNSEKTKICGMILNIGNNLCHFLPSYIINSYIFAVYLRFKIDEENSFIIFISCCDYI